MEFISNLINNSDFFGYLITFVIPIFGINAIILLIRVLIHFNTKITKIEETILQFDADINQVYKQVNDTEDFIREYRQRHSHSYY